MKYVLAFLVCVFNGVLLAAPVASGPVTLTYCYEDKPLLPHFYGYGSEVPKEQPGPAIKILRHLDSITPEAVIRYVRFPWKRCLHDLEVGKVDAIIGRYQKVREAIALYPKNQHNEIDSSRSFSHTSTCLLYKVDVDLTWDGQTMQFKQPLTMSIPSGYVLNEDMRKRGFSIYETYSVDQAHQLLFSDRVSTSLSDCHFAHLSDGFIQNPIPVKQTFGYLMFSHQFYDQNVQLAEILWRNLTLFDKQGYYQQASQEGN